jgi:ABC-type uncharacterized transport system YnjBCD permease subunit
MVEVAVVLVVVVVVMVVNAVAVEVVGSAVVRGWGDQPRTTRQGPRRTVSTTAPTLVSLPWCLPLRSEMCNTMMIRAVRVVRARTSRMLSYSGWTTRIG